MAIVQGLGTNVKAINKLECYTTGATTWVVPSNVTEVFITACAGGNGGTTGATGSAGTGGAAGQFILRSKYYVTSGASVVCTVGAGGNVGASGAITTITQLKTSPTGAVQTLSLTAGATTGPNPLIGNTTTTTTAVVTATTPATTPPTAAANATTAANAAYAAAYAAAAGTAAANAATAAGNAAGTAAAGTAAATTATAATTAGEVCKGIAEILKGLNFTTRSTEDSIAPIIKEIISVNYKGLYSSNNELYYGQGGCIASAGNGGRTSPASGNGGAGVLGGGGGGSGGNGTVGGRGGNGFVIIEW